MEFDAALLTYIAESRELLDDMEAALINLEKTDDKRSDLNAIFRAAHTIKGSAGLFGLDMIVDFTHIVESVLDKLRNNNVEVSDPLTALLLSCCDHIGHLIDNLENGNAELDDDLLSAGSILVSELSRYNECLSENSQDSASQSGPDLLEAPGAKSTPEFERVLENVTENDNWHISLRFARNSLQEGMDPLSFLRYLETIGDIVYIHTLYDDIPNPPEMDPEKCYLGFEISFRSDADKSTIEDVFEFIREDSFVWIIAPNSQLTEYINLIRELPEKDYLIGDILVDCGALTKTELRSALDIQTDIKANDIDLPLGEIVVESGMTSRNVVDAALEKQQQSRDKKGESQSIRVDADKLDHLINLIGELVIAGAGSALNAQTSEDARLIESVSTLTSLVEEVRDSALRLRMVQIGATFNRFKRVVRDVSKELNKEINLKISGAETELDKTVVEKIGDPLMHLVRNAVDHGIESAEERIRNDKSPNGTLQLNAYHDSGSIVIEVTDDGAGLNRDRIYDKALSLGLIQEGQMLEDREVYNLIFEPGFSTAGEITSLSGRGVGMDVVKRNINSLRGTIELETRPGHGTTFIVRMPLTLAIIDGFLVGVDKSAFVVPLETVVECVELTGVDSGEFENGDYLNLRGEVLPFIRLSELFSTGGQSSKRENVVVVQVGGIKAGLVVDRLMGEFQTVIKPLGRIFSHVKGISGSTILGNGEVALIIDVADLIKSVSCNQNQADLLSA